MISAPRLARAMVLKQPVGRPRPYWPGFWLAVVTFNFYRYYWDYQAHMELYHQFELRREGRRDGVAWYTMARILPVLDFVYFYYFASNLEYVGLRMGHARVAKPGVVLGLLVPAYIALLVIGAVGLGVATDAIAVDEGDGGIMVDDREQLIVGASIFVAGFGTWVVLKAIAYGILQGATNRIWASYDARMGQLRSSAGVAPVSPAHEVAGAAS